MGEVGDGVVEFRVERVEVRGDADAGAGAEVDQDFAAAKLGDDLAATFFRHGEDDDATTLGGVARTADG